MLAFRVHMQNWYEMNVVVLWHWLIVQVIYTEADMSGKCQKRGVLWWLTSTLCRILRSSLTSMMEWNSAQETAVFMPLMCCWGNIYVESGFEVNFMVVAQVCQLSIQGHDMCHISDEYDTVTCMLGEWGKGFWVRVCSFFIWVPGNRLIWHQLKYCKSLEKETRILFTIRSIMHPICWKYILLTFSFIY